MIRRRARGFDSYTKLPITWIQNNVKNLRTAEINIPEGNNSFYLYTLWRHAFW